MEKDFVEMFESGRQKLVYGKATDVFYMGKKPCIRIRTVYGYEIEVTPDHQVYTSNGFTKAGKLKVGDMLGVNGSIEVHKNKKWMTEQFVSMNKTATQVSQEIGVNVSTVKRWKRFFGIKNPNADWRKGGTPWNKGLTEKSDERIKAMADSLREHHWNGGRHNIPTPRERIKKLGVGNYKKTKGEKCIVCGCFEFLEVTHIDGDRKNNDEANLSTLCKSCHQRIHSKNLEVVFYDKITEIEEAGVLDVYDISMDGENENFIINGVVVHNCRYDDEVTFIRPEWAVNASDTPYLPYDDFTFDCAHSEVRYKMYLNSYGLKPQQARTVLPNATKTELIMYASLPQWRHVFNLRCSHAADPEMRRVMVPLREEFMVKYPEAVE